MPPSYSDIAIANVLRINLLVLLYGMDFFGTCNLASCRNCFKGNLKPLKSLSTVPLLVVGVISLLCFLTVMCFSLKDGFKVTGMSNHLAAYGTVVGLLLDVSYIYCTVKIIFCIKSITFPTWQEVRELRETIIQLAASFFVGVVLIIVAYSWFLEIGEARDDLIFDMNNSSLRSNKSDLVESDKSVVNDNIVVLDNNSSLSTKAISKDLSNLIKLGVSLSDIEFLINSLDDDEEIIYETGTKLDKPFISLIFSCLSFCLAGIVIISATIFEKKCVDSLDVNRKITSYVSNSSPSDENESSSLCSATCSRMVPTRAAGVHEDIIPPGEQGSVTISNDGKTVVTKRSEEEAAIASTSYYRVPSQEPETCSTSSNDQDDSMTTSVHLGQPPSNLVVLYPHRGPGRGHYRCSLCNSKLDPSVNVQKPQSVSASKPKIKNKSPVIKIRDQTLAKNASQPQVNMENNLLDVPVLQEKAEIETKPAATNIEEVLVKRRTQRQHDAEPNGSSENLATEKSHPINSSCEREKS